jgi:hypothetical protein
MFMEFLSPLFAQADPSFAGELIGRLMSIPVTSMILFWLPSWLINQITRKATLNVWTGVYYFSSIFGFFAILGGCAAMANGNTGNAPMPGTGAVGLIWASMAKAFAGQFDMENRTLQKRSPNAMAPGAPPSHLRPDAPMNHLRPGAPAPITQSAAAESGQNPMGLILSFIIALALFGGLFVVGSALMGEDEVQTSPSSKVSTPADSGTLLKEAQAAADEKRFQTAAAKCELAIPALKREGAQAAELFKAKKQAAKFNYKAKNYAAAIDHYTYLAKKDPKFKSTISVIKQEAWASEVKPLLAEADANIAKQEYNRARSSVDEARKTAKSLGLDVTPIQQFESRIASYQGQADQAVVARRRQAHLDETVTVRVTTWNNPMGTPTRMTRREYLTRKKSGR